MSAEPRPRHDHELPPLPPLDDDGSLAGDDDALEAEADIDAESSALEDESLGTDDGFEQPIDAIAEHDSLDDDEGASDDDDGDLAFGEERGILEGSDEPVANHFAPGELQLAAELPDSDDDGGVEGTDEDPSLVIESEDADDRGDDEAGEDRDDGGWDASPERGGWPRPSAKPWPLSVRARDEGEMAEPVDVTARNRAYPDATASVDLPNAGTLLALWNEARGATGFVWMPPGGEPTLVAEHLFPIDEEESDDVGRVHAMQLLAAGDAHDVIAETEGAMLRLRVPAELFAKRP